MLRSRFFLLALLLSLPLAFAAPTMPSQDDGGSGDDASNVCRGDLVTLQIDGDALDGELFPPKDSKDYYALEVDADDVGDNFTVDLDGHHGMTLEVFMPDCGRSVVASSAACANGDQCDAGAWHVHDDGTGHEHCDAAGHYGDEGCDTEGGSYDSMDQSVTFAPSQEGTYYVLVSIAPNAESGPNRGPTLPPGEDVVIYNCHAGCMSYRLVSTSDTVTYVE